MSDDKLVLLGRFYQTAQAHIVRALLEEQEIPCFVFDEHHNSAVWHYSIALGGVRLMVLSSDYEQAKSILDDSFHAYASQSDQPKSWFKKPYWKTFIGTIIGAFAGAPSIWPSRKP